MELEVIIMIINIDWFYHQLKGKHTYTHHLSVPIVNVTSCFKLLLTLPYSEGLEPAAVS